MIINTKQKEIEESKMRMNLEFLMKRRIIREELSSIVRSGTITTSLHCQQFNDFIFPFLFLAEPSIFLFPWY